MPVDMEWVRDLLVFRFAGALRRRDVNMETLAAARVWVNESKDFLVPDAFIVLQQHCVRVLGPPAARSSTCSEGDLTSLVDEAYRYGFFTVYDEVEFLCQISDAAKFRGFKVGISAKVIQLLVSTQIGEREKDFLKDALIGLD